MAKAPPCFDFYYNDFTGGTSHMSPAAVGCYVRLLIYQWQNGDIPRDPGRLSRICVCSREDFDKVWSEIADKFVSSSADGSKMCNLRMEQDRPKAIKRWQTSKQVAEKRRQAGRKGAESRWQTDGKSHGKSYGKSHGKPNGKIGANSTFDDRADDQNGWQLPLSEPAEGEKSPENKAKTSVGNLGKSDGNCHGKTMANLEGEGGRKRKNGVLSNQEGSGEGMPALFSFDDDPVAREPRPARKFESSMTGWRRHVSVERVEAIEREPVLLDALEAWLAIKSYKPAALPRVVSIVLTRAELHGADRVAAAIDTAIANGWAGWDHPSSWQPARNGNGHSAARRMSESNKLDQMLAEVDERKRQERQEGH